MLPDKQRVPAEFIVRKLFTNVASFKICFKKSKIVKDIFSYFFLENY